jgi:hypothetical protein
MVKYDVSMKDRMVKCGVLTDDRLVKYDVPMEGRLLVKIGGEYWIRGLRTI